MTLHAKIAMTDAHRYPWNFSLINNVEDIFDFIVSIVVIPKCFPVLEMQQVTVVENPQLINKLYMEIGGSPLDITLTVLLTFILLFFWTVYFQVELGILFVFIIIQKLFITKFQEKIIFINMLKIRSISNWSENIFKLGQNS